MNISKNEKGIALYYKIKQYIDDKIECGELKEGDKIPTEMELSKLFSVSRATVRQAINELEIEEKIIKKKGKGTYVASKTIELDSFKLYFPEELGSYHKLVSYSYEKASSSLQRILELDPNKEVIVLHRIRYFNDNPAVLEKSYIEKDRFKDIEKQNLDERLYEIIEKKYETKLTSVKATIEPIILTMEEVKLLSTTKGSPALLLSRTVFTNNNKPIIYTKSLLKGDSCKLLFFE